MEVESSIQESRLELWGGAECTINRVHDNYFEQLRRSGHVSRTSDFDRFASLGIKALRFPVLWECGPSHASEAERWAWATVGLQHLERLGIRPIVGLIHHGSGPECTNLLDPEFPTRLAAYAEQVATRFPQVRDYTPVNEPLTTARFSALYGHWYPHRRDEHSFAKALLNQCRAVVLAMQAIRRINPAARLIQTEDLGKIYSTPRLAPQAEFENERRWSSFDLLCGRVDATHRMWHHFLWAGIDSSELKWFLDHPCPPDIMGVNYYLSGERYLDEHLDRYPRDAHGGNGKEEYADVLAARVLKDGVPDIKGLLTEVWQRYGRPVAITECHNGCTREEQLRWFLEVWRTAQQLREQGAEIIAVTAWSLLGAFDWNNLVTSKRDHYEPGVYDVRFDPPRQTAIASLLRRLAADEEIRDPLLQVPGWWRRPLRHVYGISVLGTGEVGRASQQSINNAHPSVRPVLITGANGTLGRAFARVCELRGIPYRALARHALDIANSVSIQRALLATQPWAVINTAGYVRVDDAELEPGRCIRENTSGAQLLARECAERDMRLLTFSSDLVFDGEKHSAYVETDRVRPINIYGKSKAEAEKLVHELMPCALTVRASAFFGPWDEYNFVVATLRALSGDKPFRAAQDVMVSPTYVPDLVNTCLDLLIDGEHGIWHLSNLGQISWAEFASAAARAARVSTQTLQPVNLEDLDLPAKRPRFSALTSERGLIMPALDDALDRFSRECEVEWKGSELSIQPAA